eukprot:CAMPEP_0119480648 /NCGR_PEP_ID=MMETSP1344-20130328/9361_1 /TAXON_ID=236787 /ORGANISM="Florenciella parvula, Strain CCMP2471" /LENGTH=73 /DNA_ID=CAMNT_0007514977 /DNA_START=45 /DNA_END=262 /DNA_ORIENTATION=+
MSPFISPHKFEDSPQLLPQTGVRHTGPNDTHSSECGRCLAVHVVAAWSLVRCRSWCPGAAAPMGRRGASVAMA